MNLQLELRKVFSWTQWRADVQGSYKWVDKETALNMQVHPKVIDVLCPSCLQRASARAKDIGDAETRGVIRQWVVPIVIFLLGIGTLGVFGVKYSLNMAIVAALSWALCILAGSLIFHRGASTFGNRYEG